MQSILGATAGPGLQGQTSRRPCGRHGRGSETMKTGSAAGPTQVISATEAPGDESPAAAAQTPPAPRTPDSNLGRPQR